MAKPLTKEKWADLKEVLLKVPIRERNATWKNAVEMVEHIVAGRNNLVPDLDEKTGRFSVLCKICKEQIGVEDDFVRHGASASYVHYDCHHKSSGPIGTTP